MTDDVPSPDPFANPFFHEEGAESGVVTITDYRGKRRNYRFPTLFTQSQAVMMLSTAKYGPAREWLGEFAPSLKPVRLSKDRCAVVVGAYRYGRISDHMVGYNEAAIGIVASASRVPIAPLALRNLGFGVGAFVLDLPVDSAENCHRGVEIWGLPKTMKTFVHRDHGDQRTIEVRDGKALCLSLRFARGGKRKLIREPNRVYSVKNGKLLSSRSIFEGACWEFTRLSNLSRKVHLAFGHRAPYDRLAALDIDSRPLLVRDFDNLNSILFSPD